MCRAFALCLTLLATLPGPAGAGAWLRGEGEGFVAWTIKVQDGAATKGYGTLYAEYGFNPDLTVGLDAGSDELGDHKALAFVLMPLSREGWNVAFELGAGTQDQGPALRPGLSVGRGWALGDLSGWWSVDTRALITKGETALAIDATLGANVWDGTKFIAQLQQGGSLEDPNFLRLAGSVVWQLAPGLDMEAGLTTSLENAEDFGLKLGLWRSF